MIDRARLAQELANIQAQVARAAAELEQWRGAEQLCRHLLDELEKEQDLEACGMPMDGDDAEV